MFTKAYTAPKHNKQTKWLSMPEDIQKRIWKFLSPVEVFKQQVICKKYRDMLEESYESFWKEIHTSIFGGPRKDKRVSWKEDIKEQLIALHLVANKSSKSLPDLPKSSPAITEDRKLYRTLSNFLLYPRPELGITDLDRLQKDGGAAAWEVEKRIVLWAASKGHYKIIKAVMDVSDKNQMENLRKLCLSKNRSSNPFYIATVSDQRKVLPCLLNLGAPIDGILVDDWTPLIIAAKKGSLKVVRLLVRRGAAINKQGEDGSGITPLIAACSKGHERVIYTLIKRGANINLARNDGATPLMLACETSPLKVVLHMLERGAALDKRTKTGETALSYACKGGHVDTVAFLLGSSSSPSSLSPRNSSNSAKKLVKDFDPAIDSACLFWACKTGSVEMLSMLLEKREEQLKKQEREREKENEKEKKKKKKKNKGSQGEEASGSSSETEEEKKEREKKEKEEEEKKKKAEVMLLHTATEGGHLALVRYLVDRGEDVNSVDKFGRTPLFIAIEKGPHHDVIEYLLGIEASKKSVNLSDKEKGLSPLGLACMMGDLKSVSLLREKGKANITMMDREGYTPLTLAIKGGHQEIVSYLSERKWKKPKPPEEQEREKEKEREGENENGSTSENENEKEREKSHSSSSSSSSPTGQRKGKKKKSKTAKKEKKAKEKDKDEEADEEKEREQYSSNSEDLG